MYLFLIISLSCFFANFGSGDMSFLNYEWLMVNGELSSSGTPCHLLQRRTEKTKVAEYSTPSSKAVHPSRGELAQSTLASS